MPRGDKSRDPEKQKRQAEHIEERHEKRGVLSREAGAWATVNKETNTRRQEERFRRRASRRPLAIGNGGVWAVALLRTGWLLRARARPRKLQPRASSECDPRGHDLASMMLVRSSRQRPRRAE